MQARAGLGGQRCQAFASSPIRFSISTSAVASVGPSGQPATARMCCSNWLTAQAVHGPVAGVVHARRDLVDQQRRRVVRQIEHLDRQHADIVEAVGDARRRCRVRASRACVGQRSTARSWCAGCRRRGVLIGDGVEARRRRRRPRATITETSQREVDQAFEDARRAAERRQGCGESRRVATRAWPLPS